MTTNKTSNEFLSSRNKFYVYLELSKLFAKNFFKSFAGPFFTFVMPVFFLVLFYFVFSQNSKSGVHGHDIIGGYILLSTVSCGFNFLTQRICEWKGSVFLKRLNITPLKKLEFMFVIVCFYSIICMLGCVWMILWAMAINPSHQIENWTKYSNWGFIILGIILNIIVCISMAIFIGGIATSASMGEGLMMMIFFPSIFLTGIALPLNAITNGNGNSIVNYISMALPLKYSVSIYLHGWWYSTNTPPYFDAWNSTGFKNLWEPMIGAILYPVVLLLISIKTFKWDIK